MNHVKESRITFGSGVEAVQVGLPPLLGAAAEDVDALADDDLVQIQ